MAETEGAPWRDCSATDCSAVPRIEYCSHCLNRYNGFAPTADAVDASYCGVTQDGERGYTDVIAHDGSVIREPPVRATLTAGEELDVEFTITAHHKGHVELGVCCLDPPPTGFSRPKRRVAASRWSQISLAVPLPPSPSASSTTTPTPSTPRHGHERNWKLQPEGGGADG